MRKADSQAVSVMHRIRKTGGKAQQSVMKGTTMWLRCILQFNKQDSRIYNMIWDSLLAQMAKNLPAMQMQSLGQEDPLEKGMATQPSILA